MYSPAGIVNLQFQFEMFITYISNKKLWIRMCSAIELLKYQSWQTIWIYRQGAADSGLRSQSTGSHRFFSSSSLLAFFLNLGSSCCRRSLAASRSLSAVLSLAKWNVLLSPVWRTSWSWILALPSGLIFWPVWWAMERSDNHDTYGSDTFGGNYCAPVAAALRGTAVGTGCSFRMCLQAHARWRKSHNNVA